MFFPSNDEERRDIESPNKKGNQKQQKECQPTSLLVPKMSSTNSNQQASADDAASAKAQIAKASTLFMQSFAVLMSMFAFSFYVTASAYVFSVVGLPLFFLYLVQTCPPNDSFHAKVQLKRVMTGADLPDDDPNKPRGFIHKGFRNITSTLATTAATAGGYQETFYSILYAATVVKVTMPTANLNCYWIGAAGSWYYWGATEIDGNKAD